MFQELQKGLGRLIDPANIASSIPYMFRKMLFIINKRHENLQLREQWTDRRGHFTLLIPKIVGIAIDTTALCFLSLSFGMSYASRSSLCEKDCRCRTDTIL